MAMDDQAAAPTGQAHDTKVEGEVNAPVLVTLYDADGLAMQVAAEDVNAWLRKGMRRERFDIHAKRSELALLANSFAEATHAFVESVVANGQLNTAAGKELDIANLAMRDLHQGWIDLLHDVGQRFPVMQQATVDAIDDTEAHLP